MTHDEAIHVSGACFDVETQSSSTADAFVGWLKFGRRDQPKKPKQVRLGPIDLHVHPGTVLGLAGPSPLLHRRLFASIEGREAPAAGTVKVHGSVSAAGRIREGLSPWHSVADGLRAGLRSSGGDSDEASRRLEAAFLFAGMLDLAYVRLRDVSEVDRARLAVTACLLCDADIYLLDEMSLMFDHDMLDKIRGRAAVLAASGRCVVLASAAGEWLHSAARTVVELSPAAGRKRLRA